MKHKSVLVSAFSWKLLERFGAQGIQFVLQLLLARLLSPEHYGALSMMVVFTTLATVFIQGGLNTALIQNKEVTEEDYSTVFWMSVLVAAVMYGLIFLTAPAISVFYRMPEIVTPLRVLSLMLFPGALNSILLAKISRDLDFKKVFFSNLGGIIVSGIVGIVFAMMGAGLWSLVIQSISKELVCCVVMLLTVDWKPRFVFNLNRMIVLLRFGWKLLVSRLLETLYADLTSMIIGKKYDSSTLGFYSRGKQFPRFIINAVNSAVQSVMLPAMSAEQDNRTKVKTMMRTSMTMSAYIMFPMMAGLAAVAKPMVSLLLTDKWLPCVPYMQVYCFSMAFHPVHSCNLQAINAMGRSDLYLRLEIIKKSYGIVALAIAVFCFDSPLAISMTSLFTTWIGWFVNSSPNKRLIGYSYREQIIDIFPILFMALGMWAVVMQVGNWCQTIGMSAIILLLIEIATGIVVYFLLSMLVRPRPFTILYSQLKDFLKK